MALKTIIQFPIFPPPCPSHNNRPATEIRFSRWNNANAERFNHHRRSLKDIEDEIRREKRFDSASNIANINDNATTTSTGGTATTTFRSIGTPSSPSRPSIPGKSSKYSKNPNSVKHSHPAFRRISRVSKLPKEPIETGNGVSVKEDGVSYAVPGIPFELQYSYTETPKVKPIALREPPFAPFGPSTMPRPWTGRAPLPPSKKKLPEFDSFKLPPPHKKGVKPVQRPGPFLAGSGPKYVMTREEILGEPLLEEEIKELVKSCMKSKRQLNMGRDGFTHNMLDNIHAHWKRRRVCKIKCKGVCTVDMDNVRQQLEEKTGGKTIYSRGGVLFLFRGRNYNYKTRPRFPLMLWKPVTPVYPRLIQRAPEGLTLEQATEMRRTGRNLIPICKLGKNGVYSDLVENVREAFEACELVRINCQGMNSSDYHKIGAKLKDLVPCVLVSFEQEHILIWRGKDWKSALFNPEVNQHKTTESATDSTFSIAAPLSESHESTSISPLATAPLSESHESTSISSTATEILIMEDENTSAEENAHEIPTMESRSGSETLLANTDRTKDESTPRKGEDLLLKEACMKGVMVLLNQAVESGSAVVLDNTSLDADTVYRRAVDLAKANPSGPVFRHRPRKKKVEAVQKDEKETLEIKEEEENARVLEKRGSDVKRFRNERMKEVRDDYLDNKVPQGTLRVDELAKLLA